MGRVLDDALSRLRDEAGVDRLSYFHCDHFEPWRWGDGRSGVDQQNIDDVIAYAEAMREIPYARRLTLFMKSPIGASLPGRFRGKRLPGDEIEFPPMRPNKREMIAPAMRAIVSPRRMPRRNAGEFSKTLPTRMSPSIDWMVMPRP